MLSISKSGVKTDLKTLIDNENYKILKWYHKNFDFKILLGNNKFNILKQNGPLHRK